jgi:hypothetical protein
MSEKLRQAAQAVIDRWERFYWVHDVDRTGDLIAALREALREEGLAEMQALTASEYQELSSLTKKRRNLDAALEYEPIGTIDGTYAGRWMLAAFAENASAVWPEGTAVYVRRGQE